ncbi:type II secretion system secretin GspD [Diaphorobacter sp. HDW4A]|uniref:type II secretion system secretin GspD n=1 Tax=Diaphorobacter sp. HDW4A TaxID=2714924 RepID=UPI001409FD0A|nr:type II secretion system secretin GspD [Diaphorobacter sp. HDW4A]QIL81680.1 type II secretion system secretin GspD [Diaphorobacter sp. HDW4A]
MTLLPPHRLRLALHSIAASTLLLCASVPLQAVAAPQGSIQSNEPVTLNFANADIEAVARTIATITGRNVVVDPRVKGQLTLVTDKPVPPNTAFQQFLAALRLQGFTIVESAGLYKVVPEADAKLQSGGVTVTQGSSGMAASGGQIATQIFKLNFENANNLVPVLRPLISPNNTINVNPGNNSLVITDYGDNLQRIARIIAAMDVSNASDVEVISLQNAIASDLAPLVQKLIDGSGGAAVSATGTPGAAGQSDSSYRTTLLAEPRSNALIVRAANPARLALVRSLVAKLDQAPVVGSAAATGNIHVVYLKNADAVKLAATLRAAISNGSVGGGTSASTGSGLPFSGGSGGMSGGLTNTSNNSTTQSSGLGSNTSGGGLGSGALSGTGSSQNNATQGSTGGQIQADPSTNSLIITAPEPQYRQIRAVIDKLDGRRAQVLIESLIVEVSANKVAEFGIQWQGIMGKYGSTLGLLGMNSSQSGTNILDLALAAASGNTSTITSALSNKPAGGTIAIAPRINGNYYLGVLANFLENTGDANVLSTPNLLTLDNEEAQIIIGENVPFVTGSYANSTGSSTVNPFTTVERKDVGLMLRVRPQISENGTVKLTLYQEVSKVNSTTASNANGPTTSKRAIESAVLVQDGNIVVLGGLMEDSYALGQDKVPLMGDLPLVGGLFRNEQRARKKTNLMVFLRPIVIRDDATSDALVQDRYEAIRALQMNTQPADSTIMRAVNQAPVLPPLNTQTAPTKNSDAPKKQVPGSLFPVEVNRNKSTSQQPADSTVQDPNFTPQ